VRSRQLGADARRQQRHGIGEGHRRFVRDDASPRAWRHPKIGEVDQTTQRLADPGRLVEAERLQLGDVVDDARPGTGHLDLRALRALGEVDLDAYRRPPRHGDLAR
jgi:hypothetical protein